jgi:hypothetical protein
MTTNDNELKQSDPIPAAEAGTNYEKNRGQPALFGLSSAAPPKRPFILNGFVQTILLILSVAVAIALILTVMPEGTFNGMTQNLEARNAATSQAVIGLLALGDQIKDNEFHVGGEIRNISSTRIEKLDASVRFYGHDGNALETTIVRMDKEVIAPDETASFNLVHSNYQNEYARYSVEFKFRQGDKAAYKDMRKTQ